MKNIILIFSLLYSTSSFSDDNLLFKDNYGLENVILISNGEIGEIKGKWWWIPVAAAAGLGVRYCSHFGFDSNGNKYYHWSCF